MDELVIKYNHSTGNIIVKLNDFDPAYRGINFNRNNPVALFDFCSNFYAVRAGGKFKRKATKAELHDMCNEAVANNPDKFSRAKSRVKGQVKSKMEILLNKMSETEIAELLQQIKDARK